MDFSLDTCGRRRCLLLLYLFVLEAAANCHNPEGRENIVLTTEALLLNTFPEGIGVTLECANGYVKESGSEVISCTDGKWTEPDLICKKKDCGLPQPQPHMHFDTSGGTLFGAVIKVTCDKGYDISGLSHKHCLSKGWNGKSTCEIVTCEEPAEVTNGRSRWDGQGEPEYGQVINFVCDEGYILVGPTSIMCTETGEYNSEPPKCQGVTTEDRITTTIATTPAPSTQASTSTASSATSTAHQEKHVTTSATPTVSPSARGGRDIFTAEDKATTANVTSTASFQDKHDGTVITNSDTGYMNVIASVIGISLVTCIVVYFLHKFLLRKKGSYDTREDLKPELLQFQNL
ncbi:complement decay-accelerating factor-like isoform X2 [Seriola lalandi dorsalis]|uniref:complement decay-accelerating factor-like isoform X2 n=1 Tax=Seriola lalandi dorsalis TaxID=1841481 RepID=UPI000C6FC303|nr:complement decay-accelerating factor-like isoform X2 [Seriola lalandi dorsalis]